MLINYAKNPLKDIDLGNLSFLTGRWKSPKTRESENSEEFYEEHWTEVNETGMMGMFRWISDEKIRVLELIQIIKENDVIIKRLRHFNENFEPWEPINKPLELVLVGFENNRVIFYRTDNEGEWFIYERDGDSLLFKNVGLDQKVIFELEFILEK